VTDRGLLGFTSRASGGSAHHAPLLSDETMRPAASSTSPLVGARSLQVALPRRAAAFCFACITQLEDTRCTVSPPTAGDKGCVMSRVEERR
jgi:hypothetical protein